MILDFANPLSARRALDIPDSVRTRGRSADAFSCAHLGENRDTISFLYGAAISVHPIAGALLACALAPYHRCFGLAQVGARVGDSEVVQWEGVFELGDWSRITGSPLLVSSALYYLGTVPGTISM